MNAYGNTPLHLACYNGQDMVVSDLIQAGANVNQVCACLSARFSTCVVTVCLTVFFFYLDSGEREGFFCPPLCLLVAPGGAVPGAAAGPWSTHQYAGVSICRYTLMQILKYTNLAEKSLCIGHL